MPVVLTGRTGSQYNFLVYNYATNWKNIGGVYAFGYPTSPGMWQILYVGKTKSFCDRLPGHEEWMKAVIHGATHVLANVNENEIQRGIEERDLIHSYDPPLNVQHRVYNQMANLFLPADVTNDSPFARIADALLRNERKQPMLADLFMLPNAESNSSFSRIAHALMQNERKQPTLADFLLSPGETSRSPLEEASIDHHRKPIGTL